MEIVTAIVTPVVESLMVPIKRHVGYIFSYTKYVSDMRTKKSQLEDRILDVENRVQRNKRNNFEVPTEVENWLGKVAKIDAQVESILAHVGSCFNIKLRHKLGRKAFKITKEIDRFIQENSTINWTDHPIPLGKVDSMKASASTPPSDHNDFKSRERTFMEALKALQPDHQSRMIALCGMGGVGKTTMMEKLQKATEERKLFNIIVKVVIGEKANTIAIQDAVADYLGILLTEKSESARSDRLRKSFETHSDGGKKKILVIMDDVWESVHLNDMGLSPLPNQGVGFKFLLTSRDQSVCTMMGVEVNSIFKVDVIKELEAQSFFQRCVEHSYDDHELHKIGEDIVRRCCGLPIAIKTIAITLKDKSKDAWRDALFRLEHHDIKQVVHKVFEMSYKNLQDEEIKSIFLLCGLFLEDMDIPIEDLLRYGWGLELFNKVYRIADARNRLNTCIERLIHANLLIRSQKVRCVKMHDLVRDFVLDLCSKDEQMSIVGNMSKWPTQLINDSCTKISLTCTGMFELPTKFKFPNLSLLKLMHGDESLKFPKGFYENMKNLQVIAYDKMFCRSLQCSTNLRTLCLHECSSTFDCSSIGDLLNLEVLSFAHCRIKKLPSIIGNLKELKLLDLTGCEDLCIDDGVLINLVKLEELYMRAYKASYNTKKTVRFTHVNGDELVECSKNLTSLEIEFFDNNDLPKNISLKKLERFKISLGCHLDESYGEDMHSFINTLMLVTNKRELLESRMNKLFEKTEILHLQVDGMNDLGEVSVKSLDHHQCSFYNLRVLNIGNCVNLRYLFTTNVANGLTKLEYLKVFKCPFLDTLVDNKNGGVEPIKLPALKFLSLDYLPKLMSFCNDVNAIELPQLEELILESLPNFTSIYANSKLGNISAVQPLLNQEVMPSQLKTLEIRNMEKLTEIWPRDTEEVGVSELRVIKVEGCDSVVNLFPSNPMSLLHHLEELQVKYCSSIDVIFNIDLERVGEIEKAGSCLRFVYLCALEKLKEVWKIKGANKSKLLTFCGLQAVDDLRIDDCMRFRNIVTLILCDVGESGRNNELIKSIQEQEISVISNEEITQVGDTVSKVVFEMEVTSSRKFETSDSTQQAVKQLCLMNMERMSHVWKCDWNKFLISQKQQPQSSSFHNLTTITLYACHNIKYLFSPHMAKLLPNLEKISIRECDVIEEVVSNRDDKDEGTTAFTSTIKSTNLFPHLDILELERLPNLKRIGGGGGGGNQISLSNTNTTTSIHDQFQSCTRGYNIKRITTPVFPRKTFTKFGPTSDPIESNEFDVFRYILLFLHSPFKSLAVPLIPEDPKESRSDNPFRIPVHAISRAGVDLRPHPRNRDFVTRPPVHPLENHCRNNHQTLIIFPQMDVVPAWCLCQYFRDIRIERCDALPSVIPSYAVGKMQKLEKIHIYSCKSLVEIFESEGGCCGSTKIIDDGSSTALAIPRTKYIDVPQLSNLKTLQILHCDSLEYVFTFSTLESLIQLQELYVTNCKAMKVIVKEEHGDQETMTSAKVVVFPRLESIQLFSLPNLTGFLLGTSEFHLPSLEDVVIKGCPQMTVFTSGHLKAPQLKNINTSLGKFSFECGLDNFLLQNPLSCLVGTSSCPAISEGCPWPLHNMIHMGVSNNSDVKKIIPPNKLLQLQNLENIHVDGCWLVEEIFEVPEGANNELESVVVKFPNLTKVYLSGLGNLKYIWKNNPWVELEFPNLTKLTVFKCSSMEHVFTGSMVGSLLQLQELDIYDCHCMEVIVKEANVVVEEEDCDGKSNEIIMLPRLKSLKLDRLPSLKGFCLGKEAFSWPSLDTLEIIECPSMRVFTKGSSTTPKLEVTDTRFGKHYVREDLNSFTKTAQEKGLEVREEEDEYEEDEDEGDA
ncbi:hypothetical protein OSB04_028456 [Centaurea solstitialis]|uniref:Uncharacterized protein n=1 Tax=Centaurea solstitialis TaxID=347529 RepID=A0AA38SFS7_9ASTR|nr:hypothetical protein OSB04_028456 [Centaurea solstitialis]